MHPDSAVLIRTLAAQAQAHLVAGRFQQARECLFAITEPRVQPVIVKMLLLITEAELIRMRESEACHARHR